MTFLIANIFCFKSFCAEKQDFLFWQKALSFLSKNNYRKAFEFYNKGCLKGEAESCCGLGVIYEKGLGIDRNYRKAFEYYQKSCNLGYELGCTNLGSLYMNGKGVKIDYLKAYKLFYESCNKNLEIACNNLGYLYEKGLGIQQDYKKAFLFYEKACQLGAGIGCFNIGFMYDLGIGVKQDYKKSIYWYSKACNMGDGGGCTNLGYLYDKGLGTKKDLKKAVELYKKGCDLGDGTGCRNLAIAFEIGKYFQINYSQAQFFHQLACNLGNRISCIWIKEFENIPKPFRLKIGFSTIKEVKKILQKKEGKIMEEGYLKEKSLIDDKVFCITVKDLPIENLILAKFYFLYGKVAKIEYVLKENFQKDTFYFHFKVLKEKYGEPDFIIKPILTNGKVEWKFAYVKITLESQYTGMETILSYYSPYMWKNIEKRYDDLKKSLIKIKVRTTEGI